VNRLGIAGVEGKLICSVHRLRVPVMPFVEATDYNTFILFTILSLQGGARRTKEIAKEGDSYERG